MLLGNGERRASGRSEFAAYARRVRARLEEFVADAAARPSPTRATTAGICDFLPLCDAWWDEVDQPLPRRRASAAARWRSSSRPGSRRSPGSRTRPSAGRAQRGPLREAPPPGPAPAPAPRDRRARLRAAPAARRAPASRCCPTPRPATSSSTSRATRSGTSRAASSTSGACSTRTATSTPLWAARPRERAARARGVRRPRPRAPRASTPTMHVYHYARLRGHRAPPADGPLRHARGGGRRPAAPRRPRRPAQGRARRAASPRCRATGSRRWRSSSTSTARAEIKDGGTSIVEYERYIADARPGDPRRDRRLQRGGLRRDPAAARLAARAARRGARAVRPVPAARARRAEGDAAERRSSAPRCGRSCSTAGEELAGAAPRLPRPRAQAGLVGVLRPGRADARASWSRTPTRSGSLEPTGEPEPVKRSVVHAFTFPPQEHKLRVGTTPFDPDGPQHAGDDRRARPRGARARAQARAEPRRRAAARRR